MITITPLGASGRHLPSANNWLAASEYHRFSEQHHLRRSWRERRDSSDGVEFVADVVCGQQQPGHRDSHDQQRDGQWRIQYTVKANPLATSRTATITITPRAGGSDRDGDAIGRHAVHFPLFDECTWNRRFRGHYADHERSRFEMDRERGSELGDDHQRKPGNRAGTDSVDRRGEHDECEPLRNHIRYSIRRHGSVVLRQ